MTAIQLNNLWTYIQGMSLKRKDREWLAGKLLEPIADDAKTETGWADRFVGAWKDSRSAEEIVDDIRSARTANTIDVEL